MSTERVGRDVRKSSVQKHSFWFRSRLRPKKECRCLASIDHSQTAHGLADEVDLCRAMSLTL